jgi:hypothetical protein
MTEAETEENRKRQLEGGEKNRKKHRDILKFKVPARIERKF